MQEPFDADRMKMAKPTVMKFNLCGQCSQTFVVRDFFNIRNCRCPINLQCGHAVCELCLRTFMRPGTGMTCSICQTVTVPKSESLNDALFEEFSPNMYLMGHMVTSQGKRSFSEKDINFTPAGASFHHLKKNNKSDHRRGSSDTFCDECSNNAAVYHCEACNANLCQQCCKKVHQSKISKKHIYVHISKFKNRKNGEKWCDKHNRKIEFFCCSSTYCSYCIIKEHQGSEHKPIPVTEKNMNCVELLNSAAEEARLKLLRLKQTLKKTRSEMCTIGIGASSEKFKHNNIEQKLARYFSQLHGLLQLMEEKAMLEVSQARTIRERSLEKVQHDLESNIEHINSMLQEVQDGLEPTSLHYTDLSSLCTRLMETKDIPSFLVYQKSENNAELIFKLDEELKEAITKCCTISIPTEGEFQLLNEKDLPENYEIEPLQLEDTNSVCLKPSPAERLAAALKQAESRPRSSSNTQLSTTSSNENSSLNSFQDVVTPKIEIQENSAYHVYVCYVMNPGEFYVILNTNKGRLNLIRRKSVEHMEKEDVTPETVAKDELYLVQYKVDGKWYRGRIERIVDDGSRGDDNIAVYYVDYGNREFVSLSKLRCMSERLKQEPFLAHRCKLFDCVPKGEHWSTESTKTMLRMLKNALVTMYVMKINPDGCLDVDLSKTSADENIGHDICSFRDAMVFLEYANFVKGMKKPSVSSSYGSYVNQNLPRNNEDVDVVVSHVVSPSEFYVQKYGTETEYLVRMMTEMDVHYQQNADKGMIYTPQVGMPCAAQFSEDDRWYRATIIKLPGNAKVVVLYVDYGNKETVPWTKIRKLHQTFFKLVPQAFRCSLAQIKSDSTKGWNPSAKKFFEKCLECSPVKVLKMHVEARDKNTIKVLLFASNAEKEICFNSMLVEHNYAKGTGPRALKPSEILKSDIKGTVKSKPKGTSKNSLKGLTADAALKIKKRLTAEQLLAKHVSRITEETSDSEPEVNVKKIEENIDDGVLRIEIKILVLQTPSVLYAQIIDYIPKLKKLQKQLKEFYTNTKADENAKWKVDDKCAVLILEKKKWYRGIIHEFINDERVKVYLKDYAQMEEVPISYLRPLEEQFLKLPIAAIKCHLAGVKPAGNDWPSISCEFLSQEVENYSHIYFSKVGDIENNSLPVELWVKKVTPGGALEPTKVEWMALNQALVDQGLAIPVKTPEFNIDLQNYDFLFDFDMNKVDDSEKQFWKSQKEIRKPEMLVSDGTDVESDITDPGSSVSAQGSTYSTFIPSVLENWEPAKPLQKREFQGCPTYVDGDAVIYMYDLADEETINYVRDSLYKVYANSKPTPQDHFWTNGQLCIVRYHGDNNWYRGKVLNVNADLTYEVLFVDYGNVETCQIADMRKNIKLIQIPILTHKFVIRGLGPNSKDGTWPEASIEFIHGLVVDKKAKVIVEEESFDVNAPSKVQMFLEPGNLDVANFLFESKHAVPVFDDSEETESLSCTDGDIVIEEEIPNKTELEGVSSNGTVPVNTVNVPEVKDWSALVEEEHRAEHKLKKTAKCFKAETEVAKKKEKEKKVKIKSKDIDKDYSGFDNWQLPLNLNWFQVDLVLIAGPTEIAANFSTEDETLPANIRKTLKKFENLSKEIQNDAPTQPPLKCYTKGTPCISLYSDSERESQDWYRAEIEKCHPEDENLVQVYYVDYGNKEYVDKENVRVCKQEWFDVPKQTLRFKLFNMEKCNDVPKEMYTSALKECIFDTTLIVNIVIRHDTYFEVELVSSIKGPLLYQKMIDENLLKYIVQPDDDSDKENEN